MFGVAEGLEDCGRTSSEGGCIGGLECLGEGEDAGGERGGEEGALLD